MTEQLTFRATIELSGKTATGIEIPADVVATIGGGKRPTVQVTVGAHTFTTTIGVMQGRFLIPLSAQHRAAAGVAAGDVVDVHLSASTSEREVAVPADLEAAMAEEPSTRAFFDRLAYSHRKEWVRWLDDAKRPETRARRLTATVEALRAGRSTR